MSPDRSSQQVHDTKRKTEFWNKMHLPLNRHASGELKPLGVFLPLQVFWDYLLGRLTNSLSKAIYYNRYWKRIEYMQSMADKMASQTMHFYLKV